MKVNGIEWSLNGVEMQTGYIVFVSSVHPVNNLCQWDNITHQGLTSSYDMCCCLLEVGSIGFGKPTVSMRQ